MPTFLSKLEPLAYVLDGIMRSGSLYSFTGKTGSGKTAFATILSLAVYSGEGQRLLGRNVEQGRVLYIALENPDDVRMRFIAAGYLLNIDVMAIGDRIKVETRRRTPEDLFEEMSRERDPYRLVIVDTFAAHFDGKDVNSPVEGGEFMRRYRPMTQLPGRPTALVCAHPVKNASDSNLIPYGAGAILNEVDGNLTLERKGPRSVLHWQGKIRGADFEPLAFRTEAPPCPEIVDIKGREVVVPVLMPSTIEAVVEADKADDDKDIKLLIAMTEKPGGTQEEWANAIGLRAKSSVNGRLHGLERKRLVEQAAGVWTLTPKAKRAVQTATSSSETAESRSADEPNSEPIVQAA